jgi:hypothetical protein
MIAVLSAEGMRQLMYAALDEEIMVKEGMVTLSSNFATESVAINSTLFYRDVCIDNTH